MVTDADMKSASMDGKKWNETRPPSTIPPVRIRVETPTACALFPRELLSWPPRSYVDRLYNVVRWTEMPRGGHFAAMEEPELLVEDIRAFARRFR